MNYSDTEPRWLDPSENEQLTQQFTLLQATNNVAAILLQSDSDNFEEELWRCMDIMARTMDADRMYIWKNHLIDDELYCTQIYEWSENAAAQQGNEFTTNISYSEDIPGWRDTLSSRKCINGIVSHMSQAEQDVLTPQGVLSLIVVPVFLSDEFWGFVGFDDCRRERVFAKSDEIILRTAALLFANALIKDTMDKEARDTAALTQVVLTNYGGLIWSVDLDMTITLFDGLLLAKLGYKPDFFEGKNLNVALGKGRHADIIERIKLTIAEGTQDWVNEIDGMYFHHHISPVFDADGKVTCVVGNSEDISEIIRLQRDLEKAVEAAQAASLAKSNFLSNMSHEMRTPMNAIIGMTSIGKTSGSLSRKDYAFSKIEEASTHLLSVINDILDMSKIEANKFELSEVLFNFEKLVQKVTNVVVFNIDERSQKLTTVIDPNICRILIGDDQRLAQVILNLLSNAIKFTPEEGEIKLVAKQLSRGEDTCIIQVDVSDTGIGISPEQQVKLFKSFEQAENSTTRKYGGTGLGLALCKRIVEHMGGTIGVESAVGEGSTFSFTVELKTTSEQSEIDTIDESHQTTVFTDKHILLAEDVEINREIVLSLLEDTELIFDCAENGIEAVDMYLAAPEKYDLIFMDVQMPELDGLDATRQIRASGCANAKEIPIVAMTANVFREDIEQCLDAGMNAHISKPLDIGQVHQVLQRYL